MHSQSEEVKDNEKVSSLQELNKQFVPTLNEINKSLHDDKFSIKNRLLSIFDDHLFVQHVHLSYFKQYPLTANLRCGSWYVYPMNNSCYFKSTDGHFGKWNINLRRLNPNILQLIIKTNGIIIVDSTRKGKVYPDALQRTIPIWCHVLNNIFHILSKDNNNKDLKTQIPLKMPSWINDSEKEQIEQLTNNEWIKKVLSSNIINELSEIQKLYGNVMYLEPFWVDRFSDIDEISMEIKQKIESNNIIPIILLTASRPLHILEITKKHQQTLKHITMMDEMNKFNYQYIQGAGDDDEHWSFGITPAIFWENYQLFLQCNSNQSCFELLKNIKKSQQLNEEKTNHNHSDKYGAISLNELIVNVSSKEILKHMNGMLYTMDNIKLLENMKININNWDIIKMIYEQQENMYKIINHVIICMEDMNMVQKCNDYMKQNDFNKNCMITIGVYFVKDSKKYKHALRDALKLIFKDLNGKRMNKIWIYQNRNDFNMNITGCVAASIILYYIANSLSIENKIDYKFWIKLDKEMENEDNNNNVIYLSKTKIRNVLDKFQFLTHQFHPSRLLMKQINNYFLSF